MTWTSVVAVLLSPVIALVISRWLEDSRGKRRDKMGVFIT